MPDREFLADVFKKLDQFRHVDKKSGKDRWLSNITGKHYGSPETLLLKNLKAIHKKFENATLFDRTVNAASRFFQMLDRETVDAIESSMPALAGFFSKPHGYGKSFEATCEDFLRKKNPSTLYCEAAQKGDHTLIDLIPLIFCHLQANDGSEVILFNKDETQETGFAYALLLGLRTARADLHSSADIIEFVDEKNRSRKSKRKSFGVISSDYEALSWLRRSVHSIRLYKPNKDGRTSSEDDLIRKIADLHPVSLLGVERGNQRSSYLFYSTSPIEFDPTGEDQKNLFTRFKQINDHARDSEIREEKRYFQFVSLEDSSVADHVRSHLDSTSKPIFDEGIKTTRAPKTDF